MIINLFCDASIDNNMKIACGGCYIIYQDEYKITPINTRLIIQNNATNNSSEILAIWAGVIESIKLRKNFPGAVFRLFSDSKISLYGLRDWMKNWIKNIDCNGVLISSSRTPVANQQTFIDIYNSIVENNMKIELYHQRGHVKEGKVSLEKARAHFIRANKVSPEALGLDIVKLSEYNDIIDNLTRSSLKTWISKRELKPFTELEGEYPLEFRIRDDMLYQYIRCIDKTSVVSRHDFKGGFSQ